MNQNPTPIELNDVQKKRRGRPPKTDLLKNGNGLSIHRTVVPIAPYPTPGNTKQGKLIQSGLIPSVKVD